MQLIESIPLEEIRAARGRIAGSALRTPLIRLNVEDAPAEIFLKRHIGCDMKGKAVIAASALALGARQRVFLARVRMQKNREVATDGTEPFSDHFFRCRTHDHVVTIRNRPTEELVAHRAPHTIDFHECGGRRRFTSTSRLGPGVLSRSVFSDRFARETRHSEI
jgi:hypothetical protein